tara:strand:- start:4337 stop:4546 length:210 start_codon:yes stop_codon:yes gene_type:complete
MTDKYEELLVDLKISLDHISTIGAHADEDCPSEYRTKWFNPSIKEGYEFLDKMVKKYGLEKFYRKGVKL